MSKRMVTRTIAVTTVIAIVCDTTNAELYNKEYEITGNVTDEKKLEKLVKPMVENDGYKLVEIAKAETAEYCYAMNENDFIQSAIKYNSRSEMNAQVKEN